MAKVYFIYLICDYCNKNGEKSSKFHGRFSFRRRMKRDKAPEDEIPDSEWTVITRDWTDRSTYYYRNYVASRDETQLNAPNRRTAAISFGFKGDECKCLCARSHPNKRPRYVNHRSRPQTVPDQLIGTRSNWSTSSGACARNACRIECKRQQRSPSDIHDPTTDCSITEHESFLPSSSSYFLFFYFFFGRISNQQIKLLVL